MLPHRTWWVAGCAAVLILTLVPAARAAEPSVFQPPKPLRIAVGGDYPHGLDGLLAVRGLPHERVFSWELADPKVLKRFQVLLLSCPAVTRGSLDAALMEWVSAGGRVYIEAWAGMQADYPLPELVAKGGPAPERSDVLPAGDDPITKGLDPGPIDTFHLDGTFLHPRGSAQAQVLARFCRDGGGPPYSSGAAVVRLSIGRGEVIYSGAPLSFCCFHRGPTTEPLMMRIIDYLAEGRTVPRLAVGSEGDAGAAADASEPASDAPAVERGEGRAPSGFEVVEAAAGRAYDVAAQVQKGAKGQSRASVLLLDGRFESHGRAKQPALWLVLGQDRIELRAGLTSGSGAVKSARWQPPAGATELLVRRRLGSVSVMLGDRELLRARTDIEPGGTVAAGAGRIALANPTYQPVEAPAFSDDFMREPGDADPWTPDAGHWRVVGLGSEKQSVNGFTLRGEAVETSATGTGYRWWDGYAAGVAARVEDEAAAGIGALRQGNGDCVAFIADSTRRPSAGLRLVQWRGGKESVLARRPGGIEPGQWYRLGIRVREGQIEGLLDGEPVLQCRRRDPRGGGVALLVRGGSARFDDVLVQPSSEPLASPRNEGSPAADMPVSLGPQDTLTWANAAAAWTADPERPSLLWHTGDFARSVEFSVRIGASSERMLRRLILAPSPGSPETVWLAVTAVALPEAKELALTLVLPGREPVEKRVSLGRGGKLWLAKRGDAVEIRWNNEALLAAGGVGALRRAGLEVDGAPVSVADLEVRSPEVRDYVFGVAPTDWHASAGTWEVAARWACDKRWSWFAGWGSGTFAVWNKRRVEGDVALDTYVGIKMEAPGGPETTRCRDLNATLCGDGSDPRSGYGFILGGDGGTKTQLLRNGVVVAENPEIRVPAGYNIHHQWFRLRVARVGRRIEMEFEGRPVLHYDDPDPLPGGFVGLWSRDSGILVPRVTIYR